MGDTGFYSELVVMIFALALGVIFDVVGRKYPIVISLVIAGISLILLPYLTNVYPEFLILRILLSIGVIPGFNSPLLPDYLMGESLGLALAYVKFFLQTNLFLAMCYIRCCYNFWIYSTYLNIEE